MGIDAGAPCRGVLAVSIVCLGGHLSERRQYLLRTVVALSVRDTPLLPEARVTDTRNAV